MGERNTVLISCSFLQISFKHRSTYLRTISRSFADTFLLLRTLNFGNVALQLVYVGNHILTQLSQIINQWHYCNTFNFLFYKQGDKIADIFLYFLNAIKMAETKSKKSRGRPRHEPDEKARKQVETMAGLGLKADDIAKVIGVSRATLFKNYGEEIRLGSAKALVQVHQTAYEMAMSGNHANMTMFWLKCRGGWRETNVVEIAKLPKLEIVAIGEE